MQSPYQPVDVLNRLMQLLGDLDAIEPNRFPMLIRNSKSASEVYAAILALGYAANSKELRDTGDDRVHSLCHAIWELEASQVAAYRYRRGSVELLRSAMEALTDTSND